MVLNPNNDIRKMLQRKGGTLLVVVSDTINRSSLGLLLNRLARRIVNEVLRPRDYLWLRRAIKDSLDDRKLAFEMFRRKAPGRPEAVYWAYNHLNPSPVDPLTPIEAQEEAAAPLTSATPTPSHPLAASSNISMGPEPSNQGGSSGKGPTFPLLHPPPGWGAHKAGGVDEPASLTTTPSAIRGDAA